MNWNDVLASEVHTMPRRPYGFSVRRSVRTCMSCLFLFALLVLLLVCWLGYLSSQFIKAARSAPLAEQRVLQLAPRISPVPHRNEPFGIFYRETFTMRVGEGTVWLTSLSNGRGSLKTDDFAQLDVTRPDGTTRSWSRDFRNTNHTEILSVPAQDVSALFLPGQNQVTLTLRDLTPFTYWSEPYYLIFDAPEPTVTSTITVTRTPSATVTTHIVLQVTNAAATRTQTPSPTFAPSPPASPIANPPASNDEPRTQFNAFPSTEFFVIGAASISLFGLVVIVLLSKRRVQQPQPQLGGWLDLFDCQTREAQRAIPLANYAQGIAILLDPLRVQPLTENSFVAALRPTEDGPELVVSTGQTVQSNFQRGVDQEKIVLRDGEQVDISGRLTMDYRNPLASINPSALPALGFNLE